MGIDGNAIYPGLFVGAPITGNAPGADTRAVENPTTPSSEGAIKVSWVGVLIVLIAIRVLYELSE